MASEHAYRLDTTFSIYVEMERQLSARGWRRAGKTSQRFNVLMGDRFNIKYAQLLGREVVGVPQLVNYFPKTHLLTLKSAMVRRVREAWGGVVPAWLPDSYILMKDRALCEKKKEEEEGGVEEGEERTRDSGKATNAAAAVPPWRRKKSSGARAGGDATVSKEIREAERDRKFFLELPNAGDGHGPAGACLPTTASATHPRPTWILKPSSGCGGDGIVISDDPLEIAGHVDAGSDKAVYIAQQYIADPLLLPGGRKFDVRCWVLLTSPYSIYLFTEGSLRTSSTPYSSDLTDLPAHVTNHCLQAKTEGYGAFEEGNEMWYDEFDAFLAEHHPGRSLAVDVLPQVREIVVGTLQAVRPLLEPASDAQYAPFQLFGYDFLVDASFKVWLLEINGSPASAERWKAAMVRDIVRKVVDPAFPEAPNPTPPVGEGDPHFELIDDGAGNATHP